MFFAPAPLTCLKRYTALVLVNLNSNLCSSPPAFCSLDLPQKVYRFGTSQPKLLTLAPDLYRAVAPLGLEGLRRGFRLGLG